MQRRIAMFLAIASGALLALCYPRFNVEDLVWFWAGPLMVALWWMPLKNPKRRFSRGFWLGYLSGITFFAINLSWIREVTVAGAMIFPFYLGLFFAVWGGIAATAGRPRDEILSRPPADGEAETRKPSLMAASRHALGCASLNAASWVSLEWLRGWLLTGFGWNGLGVAFHQNIIIMQIAEVVGVTGLAFLPMFAGCVLVSTVRRIRLEIRHRQLSPHLDFCVALAVVAGVFLYGLDHFLKPQAEGTDLRCVIVQAGVRQELKWDSENAWKIMRQYEEYTTAYVEATDPDLVIWPESSLPTFLFGGPWNEVYLNGLLAKGDFALMLGANDFDAANDKLYNSAAIMAGTFHSPDLQVYRKIHLVPFGEFVPLREQLPFVVSWLNPLASGDFSLGEGDFARGESTEPLDFPGKPIKVAPLICFEDTVGRLARKFVRPQAQFMVNVTNDGWFGTSPAAEQHLANARFRCVELRRPMARACNTGVTCLIDEKGRTTKILQDPEHGVFVGGVLAGRLRVPSKPAMTFYARYGDLFTGVLALLAVIRLIAYRVRLGRRSTSAPAEGVTFSSSAS